MPPIRRSYWVYILAGRPHGTIYTGITNSLERRIAQHKAGKIAGFTQKYKIRSLVYFVEFQDVRDAIRREKVIKGWSRWKKVALIQRENPLWLDLSRDWFDWGTPST